jgi:hypothetical protein
MNDTKDWLIKRQKQLVDASEVAYDELIKVLETPIPTSGENALGSEKHKLAVEAKKSAFEIAQSILKGIDEINQIIDAGGRQISGPTNRAERKAS